jgi:hypothetical protein
MAYLVAVTGGRDNNNKSLVWDALDDLPRPSPLVLHVGGATGVDTLAEQWAKANEVTHKVFMAEWTAYGRSAGPIRNRKMIEGVDLLLAFPGGRGTANAIRTATELGIPVKVIE